MIADNLKLKGRLNVVVTSPDGEIKEEQEIDNLVVTTGKNFVASRMAGTSASVMSHMAIGTGNYRRCRRKYWTGQRGGSSCFNVNNS